MGWLDNIRTRADDLRTGLGRPARNTNMPASDININAEEKDRRARSVQTLKHGQNWHNDQMEAQRKRNEDEDKRRQSELKTYYPNLF